MAQGTVTNSIDCGHLYSTEYMVFYYDVSHLLSDGDSFSIIVGGC